MALHDDQSVRGGVGDGDGALRQDRQLLRRVIPRAVTHPLLAVAVGLALDERPHGTRERAIRCREPRIHVRVPVEHVDEIVEIVMALLRHVLRHQLPRHDASVDLGLKHREHVAVDLRLVGDE